MTPSNPPPPWQLFPLPTPCFKMLMERSLNDPRPPPPHFKHQFTATPLPIHHPFSPKNFDHTHAPLKQFPHCFSNFLIFHHRGFPICITTWCILESPCDGKWENYQNDYQNDLTVDNFFVWSRAYSSRRPLFFGRLCNLNPFWSKPLAHEPFALRTLNLVGC